MAKKPATTARKPAAEERKETLPAVRQGVGTLSKSGPSQALMEKMGTSRGTGLSTNQSDNMIPLIYVLQAQSPQVLKKNPAYINGAEAGDIWLRNAMDPIIKGEEGMLFQHCAFDKEWVEWVPRDDGGGFVGRYPIKKPSDETTPPVADAESYDDEGVQRWRRKNGNELILTRYHIGNVLRTDRMIPFVVPFTSTGHTTSRQWMFMMNQQVLPDGGIADGCACVYRLKVIPKSNKKGDWFAFDVQFEGWASDEMYARGKQLAAAFDRGDRRVEDPMDQQQSGGMPSDTM